MKHSQGSDDIALVTLSSKDVERNKKKLLAWLEQLPLANISKSSQQIFKLLTATTWDKMEPEDALELIEVVSPTATYLYESLFSSTRGTTIPSSEKMRGKITIAQEIVMNLVGAYDAILCPSANKVVQATAIHRAVMHLSQVLLKSYQRNTSVPKNVWLKLHELYDYSESNDLEDIIIEPTSKLAVKISVATIYKQALLLSVAKPFEMHHEDLAVLYKELAYIAEKAEIERSFDEALFVVRPKKDLRPTYSCLLSGEVREENWRSFDTKNLVQYLRDVITGKVASSLTRVNESLLLYLIKVWSVFPVREHTRDSCSGKNRACLGISAIFSAIEADEFSSESFLPQQKVVVLKEAERKPEPELHLKPLAPENRDVLTEGALNNYLEGKKANDPWQQVYHAEEHERDEQDEQDLKDKQEQWELVDKSPSGYCLSKTSDAPHNIQPGDILALQSPDSEAHQRWQITVIRWIRYMSNGELRVGVQLLADNAEAVYYQIRHKQGDKSEYLKALLLAERKLAGMPETLVVSTLPMREDDELHIVSANVNKVIKPRKMWRRTRSFCQYGFVVLAQEQAPEAGSNVGEELQD